VLEGIRKGKKGCMKSVLSGGGHKEWQEEKYVKFIAWRKAERGKEGWKIL
jgi:hypothetical protein